MPPRLARSRPRPSRRRRTRGRGRRPARPRRRSGGRWRARARIRRPVTIATRSVKRAIVLLPVARARKSNVVSDSVATGPSPGQTTADLLRDAARAHPDREAYVHGEKRVTYAWLDRAADGFAATLIDSGVAPGDVVCLLLPSSIKFATCYLGALRAGAITSAINLRLGPAEQASILERTEPAVTVVGDGAERSRRRRRRQPDPRLRARPRVRRRAAAVVSPSSRRPIPRASCGRAARPARPRARSTTTPRDGGDLAQHRRAHRARATAGSSRCRSRTSAT